jgi:hypothetical protein
VSLRSAHSTLLNGAWKKLRFKTANGVRGFAMENGVSGTQKAVVDVIQLMDNEVQVQVLVCLATVP